MPQVAISRHQGEGYRVVDAREDPLGLEEGGQVVSLGGPNDVEMEDVEGVGPELRAFDLVHVGEEGVVLEGVAVPGLVPIVDVGELGLENDGLDGVQAAIDALDLVDVLLERAVIGEKTGVPGEIVVVRDDGAGVPVGAEVLAGIEAERPGNPECPRLFALDRGEMGLGTVLDEIELVFFAYRLDSLDVRRLSEDMDGDDGLGLFRDLRLDLGRVDVEVLVDVHENGSGPGLGDRFGGRDPAIGDGDDLVSEADAEGLERDIDGIGPVGATDAMLHAVLLGVDSLEAFDMLPPDKGRLADDGLDGGVDLGLEGVVLAFEVDEGDVHDDI